MKTFLALLTLLFATVAHADGPPPSNGWNWMMNDVSESPACSGYGTTLTCYFRHQDNSLVTTPYQGGAFPAPTRLEGVLTSAPNISETTAGGDEGVFIASARGTDEALWYRRRFSGTWGPWTSLGGILRSRPACGETGGYGMNVCVVRGKDDGLYVKVFGQREIDWLRVDNADGAPRYETKTGPALIGNGVSGTSWYLVDLGPEVSPGRRELRIALYSIGTRKAAWRSLGVINAAADSDINCPSEQFDRTYIHRCAVRTREEDANVLTWPSLDEHAKVTETVFKHPAGRPILGAPAITMMRGTTGWRQMLAIRTVKNMLWMRAD